MITTVVVVLTVDGMGSHTLELERWHVDALLKVELIVVIVYDGC